MGFFFCFVFFLFFCFVFVLFCFVFWRGVCCWFCVCFIYTHCFVSVTYRSPADLYVWNLPHFTKVYSGGLGGGGGGEEDSHCVICRLIFKRKFTQHLASKPKRKKKNKKKVQYHYIERLRVLVVFLCDRFWRFRNDNIMGDWYSVTLLPAIKHVLYMYLKCQPLSF